MNNLPPHRTTAVNDKFTGVMHEQVDYFSAVYEKSRRTGAVDSRSIFDIGLNNTSWVPGGDGRQK